MRVLRIARAGIIVLWITIIALVIALAVVARGAPMIGLRPVIIRGPSMTPALPLGSVVFEQSVPAVDLRPGEIVTFSMPNGAVITHRIVRVATTDGVPSLETRGDANPAPDPTLQPASRVSGVVRFAFPSAGFLLAYMTMPTGIVSIGSLLGSLLLTIRLLDEAASGSTIARGASGPPSPLNALAT